MFYPFPPWIITFGIILVGHLPLSAAEGTCYPPGGVAGIVIATFVVTVVLVSLTLAAAWKYWKRKKGGAPKTKDKPQDKIPGDFAFDNPYFRDQEEDDADGGKVKLGVIKGQLRSSKTELSNKGKKNKGGRNHFIFGGGGAFKKQRALDDSCLAVEPERTLVALRGHDFTGLGFNICGNMRDGILVKDVLHRGPASESGRIKAGDRIMSVTVSFQNIVYEDALTILSYASPYDVQLELERIPDKTHPLQLSPNGSKRLGSCSFSGGGQKLFHPLYRSQSIDDLTQIDKDTFPSHGMGPRRSQSVGVAAHKLASHFKNSETMHEERNRSSAAVILSTTGSLNEKMLANVMIEGGLQKSGFQWEKRFEDTLDSESSETNRTSGLGDSKRETPALTNKSQSLPKGSMTSNESDRSDSSDEIPPPHHYVREKHKYHGPVSSVQKIQDEKPVYVNQKGANNGSAIKTTAQIHRIEARGSRKAKEIPETVNGTWQLKQCMHEDSSDINSADPRHQSSVANKLLYRTSRENIYSSSSSSDIQREAHFQKAIRPSHHGGDEDSDASHDSLELGNKKGRAKRSKRRSSSLGDVTQLEEAVNDAASAQNNKYTSNISEKHDVNCNKKSLCSDNGRESSELSGYNNNERSCYSNSSDQKHLRSNNNNNSPSLYVKSTKGPVKSTKGPAKNSLTIYKETNTTDVQSPTVRENIKPVSSRNMNVAVDPRKDPEKSYYNEKYEINTSRNFAQTYGSNDRIVSSNVNNPNTQLNKTFQQQHLQSVNQPHRAVIANPVEEASPPQFMRKAANPAGMFTQISPFHQPSRQKANFRPWANKDNGNPPNGNVAFQSQGQNKSSNITTCDSSREKRDSDLSYRKHDGELSKTIIISTFDNSGGRSSVHKAEDNKSPTNFRQTRK